MGKETLSVMKVALTAWDDRISPVFDSAKKLLIAEIKEAKVINKHYESFNTERTFQLVTVLNNLGIDVLICGAISETPSNIIEAGGIKLIPFIGGNIEQVLDSYAKGLQIVPTFLMPGCRCTQGRKRKGRRSFSFQQKEVSKMPRGDGTGPEGKGAGTGRGRGGCKGGRSGGSPRQGQGRGNKQNKKQGGGQGRRGRQ
jgi:predicted Fe-Mo cluster-binding NifX family protein